MPNVNALNCRCEPLFLDKLIVAKKYSDQMWRDRKVRVSVPAFLKATTATVCALVCEFFAIFENILLVPIRAGKALAKYSAWTLGSLLSGTKLAHKLKNWQEKLPGIKAVLYTAFKVIGFICGTASTATIGLFASTKLNYNLHVWLDKKFHLFNHRLSAIAASSQPASTNQLEQELDQLKKERAKLNQRLQSLKKEKARLNEEHKKDKKTIASLTKTVKGYESAGNKENEDHRQEVTELRAQHVRELDSANAKAAQKQMELANLQKAYTEVQIQLNEKEKAIEQLQQLKGNLKENKEQNIELVRQNKEIQERLKDSEENINHLRQQSEGLNEALRQTKAKLKQALEEKESFQKQATQSRGENARELERLQGQLREKNKEIESLKAHLQTLQEEKNSMHTDQESLKEGARQLKLALEEKDKKISEQEGTIQRLTTQYERALADVVESRKKIDQLANDKVKNDERLENLKKQMNLLQAKVTLASPERQQDPQTPKGGNEITSAQENSNNGSPQRTPNASPSKRQRRRKSNKQEPQSVQST